MIYLIAGALTLVGAAMLLEDIARRAELSSFLADLIITGLGATSLTYAMVNHADRFPF